MEIERYMMARKRVSEGYQVVISILRNPIGALIRDSDIMCPSPSCHLQ